MSFIDEEPRPAEAESLLASAGSAAGEAEHLPDASVAVDIPSDSEDVEGEDTEDVDAASFLLDSSSRPSVDVEGQEGLSPFFLS
jgi:hypothetical protein